MVIIDEIEGTAFIYSPAHPYTSRTTNAEIKVSFKKGIVLGKRQMGKDIARSLGPEADIFNYPPKFTASEQGAATLVFRYIQSTGRLHTTFLLGAGQTNMGMPLRQFHNAIAPKIHDSRGRGVDDHPICNSLAA
jgi:hypothetical protein